MSTYYLFYVGYKTEDDIFHAYGPYDKFGNLRPILDKSRSFISDLYEDFRKIPVDKLDDKLREKFVYKYRYSPDKEEEEHCELFYLPISELPTGDYMRKGYFKLEEILEYEKSNDYDFYFSESYTVEEYGFALTHAVKTSNQEEIERLKEFIYFCYPDYQSKEFETFILEQVVGWNGMFDSYTMEERLKENGEKLKERVILLHIC